MAKDFSRFGGGLRVFQVLAGLNFMMALLMLGAVVGGLGENTIPWQVRLVNVLGGIALASLMGWLMFSLPQRGPAGARRIRMIAWASIGVVLAHSLVEARMQVDLGQVEMWKDAFDWPSGITWMIFLIAYLESSKRARAFYELPPSKIKQLEEMPGLDELARGYGGFLVALGIILVPILAVLFLIMYLSGVPLF